MCRRSWSVISLIAANISLAAAILLAIYVHGAVGIVAVGVLAVMLVPLVSRWWREPCLAPLGLMAAPRNTL